jgi:LysM repeat protein
MGYYAVGAFVLLAGVLGFVFVVLDPFERSQGRDEVAAVSEPPAGDSTSTDPKESRSIQGSAARRMDDFGSGPDGIAVTVPLKNRHQQAYSGGAEGGGGAVSAPAPVVRVIERDVEVTESQPGSGASNDAGEEAVESDAAVATLPTFDVVRVDPTGAVVMAGRAMPSTEVDIKVGDRVIDRVTTTSSGEWVSIPVDTLAPGDQELSLTALPPSGEPVDSRQVVIVSVPEITEEATEQAEKIEPDETVAVLLDKEQSGAGRVLQAPDKLESPGNERFALKVVDYNDQGAIRLTGEAPPGVPVRIYIDNVPSALVIGDSKGDWITTLDQDLPAGDYTLRLDQLDAEGQTVARLETPLTRVAQPPTEGEAKVDYVVVQPGNSLWRIARRLSGDGFNYVYIFEANEAQIRDPDVIYPGQVFEVPTNVGVEVAG